MGDSHQNPYMEPLPTKITYAGDSAMIVIPATLGKFFGYAPNLELNVRITPDGDFFDAKVRKVSRSSLGILIPKAMMDSHNLQVGDTVDVPFDDWRRQKKEDAATTHNAVSR